VAIAVGIALYEVSRRMTETTTHRSNSRGAPEKSGALGPQ
jgi:hypothetical protein